LHRGGESQPHRRQRDLRQPRQRIIVTQSDAQKAKNPQVFPVGNGVLSNRIYGNTGLGIDLGGEGYTANSYRSSPSQSDDPRPEPANKINYGQNHPDLLFANIEGVDSRPSYIEGSINGWPFRDIRIEVYLVNDTELSNPQGKTLIGWSNVRTDMYGGAGFEIASTEPLQAGQWITATATDVDLISEESNTSEFSTVLPVGIRRKHYQESQFVVNLTSAGIPLHWRAARRHFR